MEPSPADRIAAATPATRDRYIDLLRVSSLLVVVFGHWLMAVVLIEDGVAETVNALDILPDFQPLTWVLQVMPLFFLAGGFANLTGWKSVRRRGGGYADFMRTRARRLLQPMVVFIAAWMLVSLLIEIAGRDRGLAAEATDRVGQPIWFIGIYLAVIACAPPMLWLHHRYGWRVPISMAVAAIVVDVVRFEAGVDWIGAVNFIFVWLLFQQLGFLYADGMLGGRARGALLAGGGLLTVIVLTTAGPYPTSMVGLSGDDVSNMAPPTVALLAQGLGLAGLALVVRGPVTRWLARASVWRAVVTANGLAMTIFLWHFTALVVVLAAGVVIGVAQPVVGTGVWWATRPLWIALLCGAMVPLLRAFAWADRPRPADASLRHDGPVATWLAVLGTVFSVVGVLAYAAAGFDGILIGRAETLLVLHVTPLTSGMILASGVGLLHLSERVSVRSTRTLGSEHTPAATSPVQDPVGEPQPVRDADPT